MTSGIEKRLDQIERRMARVERELGFAVEPAQPQPVTTPPPPQQAVTPVMPLPTSPPTPPRPVVMPPPPLAVSRTIVPPTAVAATPASPLQNAPIRALNYEASAPPKPIKIENAFEQLVGLKLAGWIGAIVLVIGAGFGVKYAYDQGFFKGVHPAVWLSLLSLFAFALLGAGEYVYRKISEISATGLFGAGVAMLFIVSYAGHGYYELYQRETAFTLMALSTLVGAAVSMRARLVSIAVLSLIGGTLAPLVLHGDQTLVVPFLCYLLMLQVVALVLSWWGGSAKWWTLRAVSLAGTSLWMTWMLSNAAPWGAVTYFTILYAALYHAEIVLSSLRATGAAARGAGAAFSVIITAALTAAMLWVLRHEPDAIRGIVMVAMSVATLVMSQLLRRTAGALAHAYRMQAIVLALVAVPVAFSGAAISFGWAGLAIALALVGARSDDNGARFTAIAAWGLALVNLVGWYSNRPDLASAIWGNVLGEPLAAWLIVGWILALCGHVIGYLHEIGVRERTPHNPRLVDGSAISVAASAVFAFTAIAGLTSLSGSAVLIAYAWLLIGVHRFVPKLELTPQAAGVMGLAMAKWLLFDTIWHGWMHEWSAASGYLPLVNPLTIVGALLAGTMLAALRLMPELRRQKFRGPAMWAAFAILLWTGTMEIDRLVTTGAFSGAGAWPAWQLRQFGWTGWWTVGILAFLAIAQLRDDTALRRHASLRSLATVIVLLAIKYLAIDTLGYRLLHRPAAVTVLANLQTFAGVIVFGALVLVRYMLDESRTTRLASALAMTMLLIVGSLEIDRAFNVTGAVTSLFTDPALAGQVALSIFWSLFAIAAVALGFRIRLASLRYFGLGLFAVTLAKVGVIDLQSAATGYRILSFMGLGGLLLGTSVLYGKLSPRLLANPVAA